MTKHLGGNKDSCDCAEINKNTTDYLENTSSKLHEINTEIDMIVN